MKQISTRNLVPVGVGKQAEVELGDEIAVADVAIGASTNNHELQAVVFALQVAGRGHAWHFVPRHFLRGSRITYCFSHVFEL